jgi:hypothetical protein
MLATREKSESSGKSLGRSDEPFSSDIVINEGSDLAEMGPNCDLSQWLVLITQRTLTLARV